MSSQPEQPIKPAAIPATSITSAVPAQQSLPPLADPGLLQRVSIPLQPIDYSVRGSHVEASIGPEQVVDSAAELDREGFALDTITGVDWIAAGQMEVVYDFFHPLNGIRAVVRCRVPRENPEVPTISRIFPGANWHERETHDFFGIDFVGHPNLTPFLLPEDATYHPLRKDFAL